MLIGYARTSTVDQIASLEAQKRQLQDHGCERVFEERVSSVAERAQLDAALDFIRDDDTLVVTKLDRLARSITHLHEVKDHLEHKGAHLRILEHNLDTSTATGKLVFTMIGAIGEFERDVMLERQREGIAKAKEEGKYQGRKPTAQKKADDVLELHRAGYGATDIQKQLGISRSSVYRILNDHGAGGD
jgi:DNA invertase Pin-like site-specific DNA recombinase